MPSTSSCPSFINAKCGDAFYCHANHPQHGLYGELRESVRQEMSLKQSADYHEEKAWKFKPLPSRGYNAKGQLSKLHDPSHIITAIIAIHTPELYYMLPNKYNATLASEFLTAGTEGILKAIIENKINYKASDTERYNKIALEYFKAVKTLTQDYYREVSKAAWILAKNTKNGSGVKHNIQDGMFEIHSNFGFLGHDVVKAAQKYQEEHGYYPARTDFSNDTNPWTQIPTEDQTNLWREKIMNLINHLHDNMKADKDFEQTVLELPVRELHIIIAGEEAAHEYFKSCGIFNLNSAHAPTP